MNRNIVKLKRYKIFATILNIISFPIRLPFFLIYKAGEKSEKVLDFIDCILWDISDWVVEKFKLDELAKKIYKTNKIQ